MGLVPLDMSTISNFALPLKLIEYACLGLPSISVETRPSRTTLSPDECMFFDSGDAKALAEHLDRVAEEPQRLLEYRERLASARGRLSWRAEKARYIAMLRQLGSGSRTACI